jgi:hypothetical protein
MAAPVISWRWHINCTLQGTMAEQNMDGGEMEDQKAKEVKVEEWFVLM